MGGNARVVDRMTGKDTDHWAQKLDLRIFDRQEFIHDFKRMLLNLNQDMLLWDDDLVNGNVLFNGSSTFLFNQNISDDEFLKYKPVVGDIDIVVPEECKSSLFDYLCLMEGCDFSEKFTYLGNNKIEEKYIIDQINTVFQYDDGKNVVNIQVDFEFVEFDKNGPTEFSRFGHSSSWADIKEGIKGFSHKYLLRALTVAFSEVDNAVVMTPTATPEKPRVKVIHGPMCKYAFSVSKGLRERNVEQAGWIYKDKTVFKEVPAKASKYSKSLENIFTCLFDYCPSDVQLRQFWSFVGICEILQSAEDHEIYKVYHYLAKLFWDKNAQRIDRDSSEVDRQAKDKCINYFRAEFECLQSPDIDYMLYTMKESYYKNYKTMSK